MSEGAHFIDDSVDPFRVEVMADNGVTITARLRGGLDGSAVLALLARLEPHLAGELPTAQILQLDLSMVTSFDNLGLAALADLHDRLACAGGSLSLHASTIVGQQLLAASARAMAPKPR